MSGGSVRGSLRARTPRASLDRDTESFGQHVTVEATAAGGSFLVSVSDTGSGMSQADQQKIFEEFQQADSSSTRKKGGTGLGLSIARRIIVLHGGRIWVESSPGHGSTFRFTLPVRVEGQQEVR